MNMDEILKKLLESDLLSEESKAQISEQFKSAVDTYLKEEREKIEVDVRTSLTEEFVKARDELAVTVNGKVDELLEAELTELKDDINKFRDLEVEYAERLVEEKEKLADQLAEQLSQLVDKLDAFLEQRIDEEMAELGTDIEEVKRLEFGRKIFEAMEEEFKKFRQADLSTAEQELAVTKDKLADATKRITEMEQAKLSSARNSKLEELLAPLSGTAREQMKIILSNVSTDRLEEAYKVYIGKVLKEAVVDTKTTSKDVIVEDKSKEKKEAPANVITGNEPTEEAVETKPSDQILRIKRLAGLQASN